MPRKRNQIYGCLYYLILSDVVLFLHDFHQPRFSSTPSPLNNPVTWSPPGPVPNDELLVQRARLRKGRLERNARVNDLLSQVRWSGCRMVVGWVVVTHDM